MSTPDSSNLPPSSVASPNRSITSPSLEGSSISPPVGKSVPSPMSSIVGFCAGRDVSSSTGSSSVGSYVTAAVSSPGGSPVSNGRVGAVGSTPLGSFVPPPPPVGSSVIGSRRPFLRWLCRRRTNLVRGRRRDRCKRWRDQVVLVHDDDVGKDVDGSF